MKVLVTIRPILPELSTERVILRNGFYMFYFKGHPKEWAEFLMTLPEGHFELERILRMDRDITITLARKIVSQPSGNIDILRKILSIYTGEDSIVNGPLDTYNYAILSYTYLLHEACEHGNVEAAQLLMEHGDDPLLLAGNNLTGPRKTSINSALKDLHGTDTLRLVLDRVNRNRLTDHMKIEATRQILVDTSIPDDLRRLKINLLHEYNGLNTPASQPPMSSTFSSPVSVQLCDDFDDFESADFDLKRFKDSQKESKTDFTGVTPSQIDPLGEFSQVPEEVLLEVDDYEEEDDDDLVQGSIFNTQMTDLKDDDEEDDCCFDDDQTHKKYNEIFFDQNDLATSQTPRYGTDGYIRHKISEISETTDPSTVIKLIKQAKRIVLVCGAGISVSAGIPDFRSEGRGLYALLASFLSGQRSSQAEAFFGGLKEWQLDALQRLDEPESLFDLEFFVNDPNPFYAFLLATRFGAPTAARFIPTASHHAIAALPNLLLSFTQNIDTLEASAGLAQVCYCHGSFESVSCIKCRRPHDLEYFWKILEMYADAGVEDSISFLPVCQYCVNESESDSEDDDNTLPLLKPDIVFFGESLPANFFAHIRSTLPACDLLIVTGSSMKVLPVASIPDLIPPTVPQILINKERILDHNFDLELLGEADQIWSWIARELNLKLFSSEIISGNVQFLGDGKFLFNK